MVFLFFLTMASTWAHEEHHIPQKIESAILDKINEQYQKKVKLLFQRACFDCHSSDPKFPWYHKVPLVKGIMDRDVKEAKIHLDMSAGFPFTGHGPPSEDLVAIEKAIKNDEMPPFRYKILHSDAALSDSEKEPVLEWARASIVLLKASPN